MEAPGSLLLRGAGVGVLIAGWFSHAGAASWVQMAAGATLAVSGIYLIVRQRLSARSGRRLNRIAFVGDHADGRPPCEASCLASSSGVGAEP